MYSISFHINTLLIIIIMNIHTQLSDSITIGDYIITQPFLHTSFNTLNNSNHVVPIDYNIIDTSIHSRIDYFFIVCECDSKYFDNIQITVQLCGSDYMDTLNYTFHNKILPLQCEQLYDNSTNNLLKHMARSHDDSFANILFYPLKLTSYDIPITIRSDIPIDFYIRNVEPNTNIHIYTKLSN